MELAELSIVFVLALVIISALASIAALALSVWNTIQIKAQKLSTHTVIPVSPQTTTMSNIEQELERIVKDAGGIQNDLNRNMSTMGVDADELV